ncbi:hypothetical protein FNL56_13450 [Tardiphaga sp. vice304]|uniref:phage GP46 family protein n=1 Tax=Tardiphaga sp. vice304 TaxID=2592817 RepID=UPI0011627A0C|nr:phage GP46 family protein [Tardiphaga sp. vice304]QDM27006.1 hypothetical protein FNL56_13450 [Tardiphaga sp. vice304]
MGSVRIRISEGETPQPSLLWDSVWSPPDGFADWAIAGADEVQNRGGLQAKAALHTAVVIALFTDRRMPDDHPLRHLIDDGDPRGWFGDGVDIRPELGETEMGSLLWVFERSYLTEDIRKWVEQIAFEALAPLIFQRAAVRIEAEATAQFAVNRVDLAVKIFGRDNKQIYDFRFEDLWRQTARTDKPKPFPQYPPLI